MTLQRILENYNGENPGIKTNLARMLIHGALANTGKMVILPVDQGFEHGPDKSFGSNPCAYDPEYHITLAIEAGLSAFAAPLGMLEATADKYAGQIPLILKINSSTLLNSNTLDPYQAIYASVESALKLGCIGIGFTIYPGSDSYTNMIESLAPIIEQAKQFGLICVVWAYARGSGIKKIHETALDIVSYAAHMACLLGAHIVKVKPPTYNLLQNPALDKSYPKDCFNSNDEKIAQTAAIKHIIKSCFNGKRMVIFSGGAATDEQNLLKTIECIKDGGGNGSIIGRNAFQRPRKDALLLLKQIINIYK
ncbi:fructose-bisphosphate aldolase, class I [Candidatus Xenohaliotis californiensis]|uniref:fructose-bisphosphate aldolase n=1 Tax=Candidatus Xenohaliotis californiensis TaxID=84677 RepID=A0ABP0ESH9_9RICK|nr:fructose-bisphosphate aldolase, class I [Candidatus Xenohaliotis californiensis]